MTQHLDQHSVPYQTHGGQSGSGQLTSIGTPDQHMLKVVVREAVQNIWDARDGTPECAFTIRHLADEQVKSLRRLLNQRKGDPESKVLIKMLKSAIIPVLEIADFGTRGLQGPIRCQATAAPKQKTDFIDFMYKSGSPRDHMHGGGTHGVGSNSLYALSSAHMICAYSRAKGNEQNRLMIARLTEPFDHDGVSFTGRHFWGLRADDGELDPVLDDEADVIAQSLGMRKRAKGDYGTTIMIINAFLSTSEEDDDPEPDAHADATEALKAIRISALKVIRETLLWYFWPKMIGGVESSMKFGLYNDTSKLKIPDPTNCHPISLFTTSYEKIKSNSDDTVQITCERPRANLGELAFFKFAKMNRGNYVSSNSDIPEVCNHVALMRCGAELVVKYLKCAQMPDVDSEYGGVFICDQSVEESFAAAEPKTHDAWIHKSLKRPQSTHVGQALKHIKNHAKATMVPYAGRETGGVNSDAPLAQIADNLGILITAPGNAVGGIGPNRGGNRGGIGRGHKPRASNTNFTDLVIEGDSRLAVFEFELHNPNGDQLVISPNMSIELDGGGTHASIDGIVNPELQYWSDADGNRHDTCQLIHDQTGTSRWRAHVLIPDDCAIRFKPEVTTS